MTQKLMTLAYLGQKIYTGKLSDYVTKFFNLWSPMLNIED